MAVQHKEMRGKLIRSIFPGRERQKAHSLLRFRVPGTRYQKSTVEVRGLGPLCVDVWIGTLYLYPVLGTL